MDILFWILIGLIIYSYAIYPLLLYIISKLRAVNKTSVSSQNKADFPHIAIVIAAFNEEKNIEERILNLNKINYPKDKIKYYIGSDGSTDNTNKIISQINDKNLISRLFPSRRGKASVLNDLVALVEEEIIVFSDANTNFEENAIQILIDELKDPSVGGVCGELKLLSTDNSENMDGLYWRYEKFLKYHEGRINGLLGANGAIYAIRKNLYTPIPSDTIIDDFVIGLRVVLEGYKLVYMPNAIAIEYQPDEIQDEFKRRVRIGTGNYQSLFRLGRLLIPSTSISHFFTYTSHKILRWFTPHFLVACFILSILLVENQFFKIALLIQIILYSFSIITYFGKFTPMLPKLLSLTVFFVYMNSALLVGFLKFLMGSVSPIWDRTTR